MADEADSWQAGTALAFGSDWPVAPPDALMGMYAAVHRRNPEEPIAAAFHMQESLSGKQALQASTLDAARSAGLDARLGSLRCEADAWPGLQSSWPCSLQRLSKLEQSFLLARSSSITRWHKVIKAAQHHQSVDCIDRRRQCPC